MTGSALARRPESPAGGHELASLGVLAGEAFGGLTDQIRDVHRAVADRIFGATGDASSPAKLLHDGISRSVYSGVRMTGWALGVGAGALARQRVVPDSLSSSPRGRLALGALNGAVGDLLDARNSPLAVRMSVRLGGRDITVERTALVEAYPGATRRLVLFVHGLGESDESWGRYGDSLREALGYTPLLLRYNTGLEIAANGRELARLMDGLVEEWPEHIDEIAVVGHSMGGLVMRSAVQHAEEHGHLWPDLVSHVVYLGSPHGGAPLARGADLLERALLSTPETAATAGIVGLRSRGIRDLVHRYGAPLLPSARHHVVAATLGARSSGVLAATIGDLLVPFSSATGIPCEVEDVHHLPRATHFALLDDPAVDERLRAWLA